MCVPRLTPVRLLLFALLATACGGGGGDTTRPPDDGGGGGTGELPPFVPNPLDVSVTVDPARSGTALITPSAGGTLSATGSDGTSYTLVVPSGALFDAVDIRMTPVTAVEGSPLSGGLVGAVQLEPAGLRLADVATLTVVPAQAIDAATTAGFGTEHDGSDFHLMPGFLAGPALVLRLNHFSVKGFARGTTLEQRRAIDRVPRSVEAYIASIIAAGRRQGILGIEDDRATIPPDLNDLIKSLVVEHVILPRFEAGRTDCFAFIHAMHTYVGWIRQHALQELDAEFAPGDLQAINAAASAGAANCAEELRERCIQHDIGLAVTLIGMGNTLVLFGVPFDQIAQSAVKCLHFELEYDAALTIEDPTGQYSPHGRSTVPLGPDLLGTSPLEAVSFQYNIPRLNDCLRPQGDPVGTTFSVDSAVWHVELLRDATGASRVYTGESRWRRLELYIDPGRIQYFLVGTCPRLGNRTFDYSNVYQGTFLMLHTAEAVFDETGSNVRFYRIAFPAEQLQRTELLAQKSYTGSVTSVPVVASEATSFKLYHRPQP